MTTFGYKSFDANFCCRGMQYKVGGVYSLMPGIEPALCRRGFHFCKEPVSVLTYYTTRFARVKALGMVVDDEEDDRSVTNKIEILEELTCDQLMKRQEWWDIRRDFDL